MISGLFRKIVGSRNERLLKRLHKQVEQINAYESDLTALSDSALQAKTDEFRGRYNNGETLDDLLPEAFAVVRESPGTGDSPFRCPAHRWHGAASGVDRGNAYG